MPTNKILNSPIIDASLEIRFSTTVPPMVMVGVLLEKLGSYSNVEELPITQVPQQIRLSDPNFKFKAYYRLPGTPFDIQVGPDVITVTNTVAPGKIEYAGWDAFKSEINRVVKVLKDIGFVQSFDRIGLRYMNLLDAPLAESTRIDFKIGDLKIGSNIMAGGVVEKDEYELRIQAAGDAALSNKNGEFKGALLDLDATFNTEETTAEAILDHAEELHSFVEDVFNMIVSDDFKEKHPVVK